MDPFWLKLKKSSFVNYVKNEEQKMFLLLKDYWIVSVEHS
jgi:hypothetical protein